ncbi:uncharacterized protein LOC110858723 isoform X2 [Folsomia candida]|uniref:uncharacterized protein LOC110858723 isoform X2 n=1 Tax=Folsomia candida TaxID=158441 RepID=UPI001604FD31|nr:uncharacterized protein LOC110858723 isoform X2 [Folsomia candida]
MGEDRNNFLRYCWHPVDGHLLESHWGLYGQFVQSDLLEGWVTQVCCYICTRRPARRPRSQLRRGRSVRGPPPRGSVRMKQRSIRRSARISQRSADSAMSDSVVSTLSEPGVIYASQKAYSSTMPPRTTQPKSIHQHGHGHSHTHHHKRSTKSAEPEFGPNLPVLYNKYAEDLVPVVPAQTDQTPPSSSHRISRNRSVPPELMKPPEEPEFWDEDYDDYDESDYEDEDPGKRPVPIWLCSALVIGYIIGGAFLFSKWEEWNFLDSAYFCFITLTTIGFGDFVPTQESEASIALCSLYLLFGIALLAMSFNLVQEQVINSVKELAMTLGIIDEEDDRQ